MAFKSVEAYNKEQYGGLFRLPNDQDCADVIFLYTQRADALVADTHYIKTADYSGYVHCTGRGCPACAKGIRKQTKIFVPLFNITDNELQLWDRTPTFEPQLNTEVFSHFPNPSEFVFRITRHGVPRDVNTRYQIVATGNNKFKSFEQILSENNISFPAFYERICRDVDAATLSSWLSTAGAAATYSADSMPDYTPTPRANPASIAPSAPMTPPPLDDVGIDAALDAEEVDPDVNF